MIDKIKNILNNSFLWLLALVAAVFYFWRKEKDLEYQLQEQKADAAIKTDKEVVAQADKSAADAVSDFNHISAEYEHEHPND